MADVVMRGPLFDGRADQAMNSILDDCSQAIAERAANDVRSTVRLAAAERTGNYERHVQIDRAGNDRAVNDGSIVYGPWLEGVSARNYATRFRGFAQFRKATRRLASRTAEIAEPIVRRNLGRLQ